ncbi:hypothetical protein [Streptomyces hoynatensis]|uniref:FtsK domain-containing protein n=1 Tax=Streptomyces hoynatensis TaxID=1141874 RepID=A0A3A9YTA4_9ACTN|nr:hypothetical protein [Streptomyces hoynatensis]RKN38537.1 hypothetical protein D7294_24005 [Streptomyces hoynatensis]
MPPLRVLARGFRLLAAAAGRGWSRTPRERRGPLLALGVVGCAALPGVPYAWWAVGLALPVTAAWLGWRETREAGGPPGAVRECLGTLYEALVPYFSAAADPSPEPLFAPGGEWERCFTGFSFGSDGRIARLTLRYPAFFPDGDPACRARVERVLAGKAGRDREFAFRWEEERNRLEMALLAPLPTGICAQRFVTSAGETVLGFTDAAAVDRTVPVRCGLRYGLLVDAPPVVWRTGPRSAEPNLLVVGAPGAGATTLLRSIALQALEHGEVLLVDGSGTGEFACFAGRAGVVGVEAGPVGAVAALEWAERETERRLLAAGQGPRPGPAEPALWIVVDRPALLGHLARIEGVRDPLGLLEVPLRYGRAGRVTVVLAEQFEAWGGLGEAVLGCTRARVVLGAVGAGQAEAVLGVPPPGSTPAWVPPGRGYARLGSGRAYRMQVPATPDPYDDATPEPLRGAVLALLPRHRRTAVENR